MIQTHRLAAEPLEARIAPAGIVQVTVRGGDLFLSGDAGDHVLEIGPGPDGSLIIYPLTDTELRVGRGESFGTSLTLTTPIRDIHYTGGSGADDVRLVDLHTVRHVRVALGGGENGLLLTRTDVLGDLRVSGNGEVNTVRLFMGTEVTTIGGDLAVLFTRGTNLVAAEGAGLQVGGSVKFAAGSGPDDVTLTPDRVDVLGSVEMSSGRGSGSLYIGGLTGTTIHGAVTLRTSGGLEDNVALGLVGQGEMFVGGEVRVFGGGAHDELALDATRLTLAKGLTARLGGGANGATVIGEEVSLGGALKLASDESLRVNVVGSRLLVEGGMAVQARGGEDDVVVRGTGVVRGKVSVDLGAGASQVTFEGAGAGRLVLEGGLAVTAGALADPLGSQAATVQFFNMVLNGRTSIQTGGGGDSVYFSDGEIHGPVVVNTGGNSDYVVFFANRAPLTVAAPVTILAGSGDDIIGLGLMNPITATALITVIGGAGADHLDYLANGNTFTTPPRISGVETFI